MAITWQVSQKGDLGRSASGANVAHGRRPTRPPEVRPPHGDPLVEYQNTFTPDIHQEVIEEKIALPDEQPIARLRIPDSHRKESGLHQSIPLQMNPIFSAAVAEEGQRGRRERSELFQNPYAETSLSL